jgi:type II secretory pathway pseudopilin PulG
LIELVVTVIIIGFLVTMITGKYIRTIEREGRATEARGVLNRAYAGYQRLVIDEEPIAGLPQWQDLGMPDPSAMVGTHFAYSFLTPTTLRAIRTGDATKWLEIDLTTGTIATASYYE